MPKLLQAVACALLCCALRGASAVTYGQPGVGSQYQLFGGPITDTSVQRVSPIRSGSGTVFAVAADPNAPASGEAKQPQAHACDSDFVYSDVFQKCLPAPGKDGYIGKAYTEQAKGKAATESSAFVPIGVQTFAPMVQPLRTAALSSATDERPPQPPQQPLPRAGGQMPPRGRPIAPVRQLRLACPAGFGFEPAMGACIAPASALQQQQAMHMRMNRRDDEDDDNDDSDEELRFGRHRMFGGRRFHRHMFGRRFGLSPRILAPVFVFVLPPSDRNATRFGLRFGERQQRIHEIHPSMVGPIGGATTSRTPAAPEKSAAPEKPKAIESEPKPTPGPKGMRVAGSGAGSATESGALRGAFVNPIVSSGKTLPLKSQSSIEGAGRDEPIRGGGVKPIRGDVEDSAFRGDAKAADPLRMRLLKRHAFVSPLIQSHSDVDVERDAA